MRAILTADTHIHDDTPEDMGFGLKLFDDAGALALSHSCRHVIVAGDILHYKHRLSTRLLVSVFERLASWKQRGVNFILLRGNHDVPDLNDPEYTPLRLFAPVATVITRTTIVEEEDAILAFVPWYPADRYIVEIAKAAKQCLSSRKPRILISHVSIKEGKISPSNTKVTTPVRVEHLQEGVWTGGVYLGDYHAAQSVTKNIHYLGAPRPTTHGDFDCLGMWLLTASGKSLLQLPSRYPAYRTYRVDSAGDLPLHDWDKRNKNRIFCASRMVPTVTLHYPTASVILLEETKLKVEDRLGGGRDLEPIAIAKKWREGKNLPADPYDKILEELLG